MQKSIPLYNLELLSELENLDISQYPAFFFYFPGSINTTQVVRIG